MVQEWNDRSKNIVVTWKSMNKRCERHADMTEIGAIAAVRAETELNPDEKNEKGRRFNKEELVQMFPVLEADFLGEGITPVMVNSTEDEQPFPELVTDEQLSKPGEK